MRFTTYSKYHPELADAVNLQGLLDQLTDFLLQSGFAGGSPSFWHDDMPDGERSMDALRQAILQALIDSGQLTPDMLKVLRGESTGDVARDKLIEQQLGELLDKIVQRLIDEGYLNVTQAPQVPQGYQSMFGPGGQARSAAQQVQFNLTEKGIDFLGYKTLKNLLGRRAGLAAGAEHALVPLGDLGRLGDVEVALVDQALDDLVEQLAELLLDLLVARGVAGGLAAEDLEHVGGELPRVDQRLEDGLAEGVHGALAVGHVVVPEGGRPAGEAALEQEVGQLVQEALEVDGVGELGVVFGVRRKAHGELLVTA